MSNKSDYAEPCSSLVLPGLTPNLYYSCGLAKKKRLQGKKKKKGDTTPVSSTFVLSPAAA